MAKLRDRLLELAHKIGGDQKALERAQNRWTANHLRAVANHRAALKAERLTAKYNRLNHPKLAAAEQAKAARCHYRAAKAHDRAVYWVGRVKELTAQIAHLEQSKTEVADTLHKLEAKHGATADIPNNKVTGGTAKQRVALAMHTSMAHAREFYSMAGTWSVRYCLTGPPSGYRYDCSSWFTSVYYCCGLPDPNHLDFNAGWTGSLGEHGKAISESSLDSGDAILFGYAPFHHVEMKDGPMASGPYTVGHGSTAVDRGTVYLLPGPRAFRRYL